MRPEFDRALSEASGVLFLCSGNMVRSAFADLYARHLACPLPVSSAATVFRNDHLLSETAAALRVRGVPDAWTVSFRPRHVTDLLAGLDPHTLVLAMARAHMDALKGSPLRKRAFLFAQVLGEEREIRDPVLDGADFERTFEQLARCVEALVARLKGDRRDGAGSGRDR